MSANKQVLKLVKATSKFYKKQTGRVYPDAEGNSRSWNRHQRYVQKMIDAPEKYYMTPRYLANQAEWYLDYSQFARAHLGEQALQTENFAKSAWCGYLAAKVRGEFNRFRAPDSLGVMSDVLLFWSNCVLAGWYDEAIEIAERCLNPAEKGGWLILDGYSFATASFFLLELHCLWQGIPFDRKQYDHPLYDGVNTPFIYDDILKNWKTPDLKRVDTYISQMADYHLTQTKENTEEDYFEFNYSENKLYPYEIMAWLKLREHLGIPNPKEFSHPFMNQPLAEFIPGSPLTRPQIEQADIMLAICRKALPKAEF